MIGWEHILAIALSTGIAAALRGLWERKKERAIAADAAAGTDANLRRWRRLDLFLIIGLFAFCAIAGVAGNIWLSRNLHIVPPEIKTHQAD